MYVYCHLWILILCIIINTDLCTAKYKQLSSLLIMLVFEFSFMIGTTAMDIILFNLQVQWSLLLTVRVGTYKLRYCSFGIWCYVTGQLVSRVSGQHSGITFNGQQVFKRQEQITQRHVTSQHWYVSYTAAKNLKNCNFRLMWITCKNNRLWAMGFVCTTWPSGFSYFCRN